MKWDNACILNLQPNDPRIINLATAVKERYGVPDTQCYAVGNMPGWTPATPNCLQSCTLDTKLLIVAHGSPQAIRLAHGEVNGSIRVGPATFGQWLYHQMGLRAVGLIAFKACGIGQENYLDKLKDDLDLHQARVGWFIGYKATTGLLTPEHIRARYSFTESALSKLHPNMSDFYKRGVMRMLVAVEGNFTKDFGEFKHGRKLDDAERITIVPGNAWQDCIKAGSLRYGASANQP